MKRTISIFLMLVTSLNFVFAANVLGSEQSEKPKKGPDLIKLLKDLIRENEKRVAEARPIYYNMHKNGWAKRKMKMLDIEYDVRKTDSLVSPFLGIVTFNAIVEQSEFFPTKIEAEAATSFQPIGGPISGYSEPCRITYAFQDKQWVIKTRESYSFVSKTWDPAPSAEPESWPAVLLFLLK